MTETSDAWPSLPFPEWRDTCATLQLWTQVVGKIRLARAPLINHCEFILPYDRVREDSAPDDRLLEFCESTYAGAADLARWNRAELERGAAA
jgi:Family of unknown function (DUF5996)